MKQERTGYAYEKRRSWESDLEPSDLVLLKQRKENEVPGGGGGSTPLYGLCGDVPLDKVWFSSSLS